MDKKVLYAKKLRKWQEEHPVLDVGLSFVPGVGQAYGAASSAATLLDPDASALEKGMVGLDYVPGGKLGKKLSVVVGSATASKSKALADSLRKATDRIKSLKDEIAEKAGYTHLTEREAFLEDPDHFNKVLHQETGWFKDPVTGRLMHEIDDSASRPDFDTMEELLKDKKYGEVATTTMEDVLRHDELYKHDPSLKDIDVELDPTYHPMEGMYDRLEDRITHGSPALGSRSDRGKVREAQLHELQHAIAKRESFAAGTSKEAAGSYERYMKSPGEILARIAALRRNMTKEARQQYPFYEHMKDEVDRLKKNTDYANVTDLKYQLDRRGIRPDDALAPGD